MAPKPTKRTPKSFTKPAAAVTSNSTAIPTPFTTAPACLEPLLPQLDPSKVHLIHVDRHPIDHKKQIFLIPLLLNTLVLLALLYRAYTATPTYLNLLKTILGHPSPTTLDPLTTTNRDALLALAKRTLMILLDFLLLRFLGPWPLNFFLAQPSNPLLWRWNLGGFQSAEVIVRASRHWGVKELLEGVAEGEENAFFTHRILPAIERHYVRSKTGYLMQSADWELDFASMQDAHTLIQEQKRLTFADVDRIVLAHLEGKHGWVFWRWEVEGDVIEHRRRKVVQFKEVLVGLGKESLFWKWAGIVEEEREGDGGFSEAGQKKVVQRVSEAFEKEGVDFEEVVRRIGGLEEVAPATATG